LGWSFYSKGWASSHWQWLWSNVPEQNL
jgi:hypothetical protein